MITLTFKDMAAPVTDDEREKVTNLLNKHFYRGATIPSLTLSERDIFVLTQLYKEAQDALFEISKSGA